MADESRTNATADSSTAAAHWKGTSRYEVLGCLGQGGMGLVYDVFDKQRQERIALKTLVHFDASNLYRFKQEFRTLADVLHPNLVHLHELVADERDAVFFTMELIEGEDFLGYVHKAGTPRVAERTRVVEIESGIHRARPPSGAPVPAEGLEPSPADFEKLRGALCQLVEGVRALHAAGKLHRDLKPSNVRVTGDGRAVILDFGVATELRRRAGADGADGGEEEIVGTVTYMAPEQASGEAPVAASDWYSVGAMLYEALVGRPPFSGSALEVLTMKYTITPTPPSECVSGVPQELNDLCMALLAPDPEQRPTGVEILRRLGVTTSDRAPAPQLADRPEATRLVGREGQLRALKEAFDATGAGRSVAVRIAGLAGLGKSAVVHHFLDGLEQDGNVVVLRGRVYQRESMPYKAVDSVVDSLSRHLMDLQAREGALTLPRDIWALSHVFPVLRRVHSIEDAPQASIGDPQVIRQLAFDALRELFATLTKRQRVVVFIDDVQWGDTDSAALLVELLRSPGAPSLLLVTTHRTDEADASAFLSDLSARWPEDTEVRELTVEPLDADDSARLALALLGSDSAAARQTAEGIARESRGNPFLLEELARSASGYHRVAVGTGAASPGAVFSIEQILGERLERLPDDARRLLEVVAVGGRPLPVSSVGEAANTEEQATQLVALLRARRFVRAGLRDGRDVVEVSHDRIRDTIIGQLPPETVRGHHAQLARVLEASPESDPEAIASHLLGAGDKERAALFAERAAEQAVTKLAFAQAARLYQVTCDMLAPGSPDGRRLKRRLAEACEWAGYAERAARAYLTAAADGASEVERVELESLATAQLIAAGCIDESAALSRKVLAAVGRKVPDTLFATMFWVTVYRIASMFLMGRKLKDGAALSLETIVRLNALHALGRGLAVIDPFAAMYVKARNLVDALRSGSRSHVIRAAAAEASSLAAGGGRVGTRERMLFEMSRKLSTESKDGAGYALYRITYGVCEYLRGRWRSSVTILDEAAAMLVEARRWAANATVFSAYSLVYLGDLREVKSRAMQLIADAERRGDLYTVVNLRASHPIVAWIAADDLAGARRHIRESMSKWSKTGFLIQHWQSMVHESECDLYAREGVSAWERLSARAPALGKSHLLDIQLIRILTNFARGRAAIASLAGLPDAARGQRLEDAKRSRRLLERETLPWPAPLAAILSACVANVEGDRRRAESTLRRAIELATIAEMFLHAEAARHQLGTLLGGQQGATMVSEAAEAMKARGVRVPERYAQMLVPGPWRPVSG